MMSSPKVSIVTPSFNQAQFLEKTILSVLGQDYPDIEYIVIDGGSTDGSQEIIKKYQDRIAYWVSEKDGGQSDAINKGFRKCTGDIVAWINSDDRYTPGAVSRMVRFFSDHPGVDMVHGDVDFIDADGKVLFHIRSRDFTLPELLAKNRITQPSTFWKREIFDGIGYLDEKRHYLMDYDFWIRAALKYDIRHIDATISQFRLHGDSKTVTNGDLFLVENLVMLEEVLSSHELPADTEKSVIAGMQHVLPKFQFSHLDAIRKHLQRYDPKTVAGIMELADYRATLLDRRMTFPELKAIKARVRDYFRGYLSQYGNYDSCVTDRSLDEMVTEELFSICGYLCDLGQKGKSVKLFALMACTGPGRLKYDSVKNLAKKYAFG